MKSIDCQDYMIHIGSAHQALLNFLERKEYTKIGVLVDNNTRIHCLPKIQISDSSASWTIIEIEAGEEHKNIETCEKIWNRMLMAGFDRHSLLINLGGGVIGDMGGFCASTYMRGIDFIQIPTTVLAQVDASVGGKLGVDFQFVKNIIGLFTNPKAVIVDPVFHKTLKFDQLRSGFAEVVKHSLIADPKLWKQVKSIVKDNIPVEAFDNDFLYSSILVKKQVVEQDPIEQNLRKILNYGHTIGHAVETISWESKSPLLHGEAIYIGMMCENYIAFRKNLINKETLEEINSVLKSIFYQASACVSSSEIWKIVLKDKKNRLVKAYAALLDNIGSAVYNIEISNEEVVESLFYYQKL